LKITLHRIVSLTLLLCFGIGSTVYVFLGIEQLELKKEAKNNISEEKQLTEIRLSLKEWQENGNNDEIWYGGELYDLNSHTILGDSVALIVFHDEHEESLIKTIADSFEPEKKMSREDLIHLTKHRIHLWPDNKILPSTLALKFESYNAYDSFPPKQTDIFIDHTVLAPKRPPRLS